MVKYAILGILGAGLLTGCQMPERNSYNGQMGRDGMALYCSTIGQTYDRSRFACVPPPQPEPTRGTIYDGGMRPVGTFEIR